MYFSLLAAVNSFSYFSTSLTYILLLPEFSCQIYQDKTWLPIPKYSTLYEEKCKPEYFCERPDEIKWSIVEDSH